MRRTIAGQQGVMLIEALVGILIFSMGILTLVALQASAISAQSDAQYRVEAANRAEELLSQIWVNVDRTSAATIQSSLAAFEHQPDGAASSCSFSGTPSGSTVISDWVDTVTNGSTALPGVTTAMQQVIVDTSSSGYNRVTVTLCWRAPQENVTRRHTVSTFVN